MAGRNKACTLIPIRQWITWLPPRCRSSLSTWCPLPTDAVARCNGQTHHAPRRGCRGMTGPPENSPRGQVRPPLSPCQGVSIGGMEELRFHLSVCQHIMWKPFDSPRSMSTLNLIVMHTHPTGIQNDSPNQTSSLVYYVTATGGQVMVRSTQCMAWWVFSQSLNKQGWLTDAKNILISHCLFFIFQTKHYKDYTPLTSSYESAIIRLHL